MTLEHLDLETIDSAPDDFTLRLKALVARAGSVSALAKRAGISHSGLLRYLAGGDPSRKVLVALAQAAAVDLDWLATGRGNMAGGLPKQSLTMLPLYEAPISDAQGRDTLTELAFCRFWLERNGLNSSHLKALAVQGDSMAPHYLQGDTLLIDVTKTALDDGKVVLIEDCGSLLLRRLQIEVGGIVRLVCDNPAYRSADVVREAMKVIGSVVWSARLA